MKLLRIKEYGKVANPKLITKFLIFIKSEVSLLSSGM
jgi:hypothetical protein